MKEIKRACRMIRAFAFCGVLAGCASLPVDFIKGVGGVNEQAIRPAIGVSDDREFLPFGEALIRERGGLAVELKPAHCAPELGYHYFGWQPVSIKPDTKYRLTYQVEKAGSLQVMFNATFLCNGLENPYRLLSSQGPQLIASGHRIEVEIVTPRDAREIILWSGFSELTRDGRIAPFTPGCKLLFQTLELSDIGPFNALPPDSAEPLLLMPKLESLSAGPLPKKGSFLRFGSGKNGVLAEIIHRNEMLLHIVKTAGQYKFPHIEVRAGDFLNRRIRFSFQARGKGIVRAGLWQHRLPFPTRYEHGNPVKLSDEWQEVSYELACTDPLTKTLTASLAAHSEELDMEVRTIRCDFIAP